MCEYTDVVGEARFHLQTHSLNVPVYLSRKGPNEGEDVEQFAYEKPLLLFSASSASLELSSLDHLLELLSTGATTQKQLVGSNTPQCTPLTHQLRHGQDRGAKTVSSCCRSAEKYRFSSNLSSFASGSSITISFRYL